MGMDDERVKFLQPKQIVSCLINFTSEVLIEKCLQSKSSVAFSYICLNNNNNKKKGMRKKEVISNTFLIAPKNPNPLSEYAIYHIACTHL